MLSTGFYSSPISLSLSLSLLNMHVHIHVHALPHTHLCMLDSFIILSHLKALSQIILTIPSPRKVSIYFSETFLSDN
jgi:hypothetical protein